MQRGCTDRWCCANKQTGASKESKLKPLYYSLVLWAQAVGCRQGVTTNACKMLLLIKITSHLHGTGTCSADHSKANLRILPHALIFWYGGSCNCRDELSSVPGHRENLVSDHEHEASSTVHGTIPLPQLAPYRCLDPGCNIPRYPCQLSRWQCCCLFGKVDDAPGGCRLRTNMCSAVGVWLG
jgi:hypothetical protein